MNQQFVFQLFLSRILMDFDAFVCYNCASWVVWVTMQCRYVRIMNIFWIYPPPFNSGKWRFSSGSATKNEMSSWWWFLLEGGEIPNHIMQNLQGHGSPSQKSHQQNCQYCISWWSEISADFFYNSFFFDIYFVCQTLYSNQSIPKSFQNGSHLTWYFQLPRFLVFSMDWLWPQRWGPRTWNVAFPCPRDVTTRATQRAIVGRCGCGGLVGWKLSKLPSWQNLGIIHPLDPYHVSIWGA